MQKRKGPLKQELQTSLRRKIGVSRLLKIELLTFFVPVNDDNCTDRIKQEPQVATSIYSWRVSTCNTVNTNDT